MRSRISPSTVLAALALFVALGGTGYAAAKITSKDVKNGSLTGRDIKNRSVGSADVRDGSLRARDFRAGVLAPRAVQPGPAGPQGPPGAQGPKGEAGPSELVFKRHATRVDLPSGETNVSTVTLPPGDHLLTATGTFDNDLATSAVAACEITGTDLGPVTETRLGASGQPADRVPFAITTTVKGGEHALRCRGTDGAVDIEELGIAAVRVGKVTDVSPPPGPVVLE